MKHFEFPEFSFFHIFFFINPTKNSKFWIENSNLSFSFYRKRRQRRLQIYKAGSISWESRAAEELGAWGESQELGEQ